MLFDLIFIIQLVKKLKYKKKAGRKIYTVKKTLLLIFNNNNNIIKYVLSKISQNNIYIIYYA